MNLHGLTQSKAAANNVQPMLRLRLSLPPRLARPPRLAAASYAPLRGDLRVDVATVDGGITGAVLAWRFANAGVRVALLEATQMGRGSTAASTALLMQEPDDDFTRLARRYGRRRARGIWELSRRATRHFISTLRRLSIRCEFRPCDSVYYTLTPEHVSLLRGEHEQLAAAGLGGRWLEEAAVRRITGLDSADRDLFAFGQMCDSSDFQLQTSNFRLRSFDLERALGEHCGERPGGREHRREHCADNADGHRKLDDRPAILLDDDPPDVPLMDDLLQRVHELIGGDLERFLEGLFWHLVPSFQNTATLVEKFKTAGSQSYAYLYLVPCLMTRSTRCRSAM
jgi:hypothetical protein